MELNKVNYESPVYGKGFNSETQRTMFEVFVYIVGEEKISPFSP